MIFIRDYVILLLRHNLRFTNWLLPKTFSKNKNSKLRSPTLHKGEKNQNSELISLITVSVWYSFEPSEVVYLP